MGKKSPGVREMIEPVNTQDFTSQPERRKPEQFEHVKFRIDGGVARMTLNRPDHNLLNEAMLREIAGGITHAGESVCVVNGPAIGGGAELAAFGDLVIATPKARFAQPEISIGIFPPLASTILPFLVGPKIALELVLTGEPVTAERALELGMVNRLVPEAQLEKTVNDLVGRINSHSGPVLTMAKKAILSGMGLSLRDG